MTEAGETNLRSVDRVVWEYLSVMMYVEWGKTNLGSVDRLVWEYLSAMFYDGGGWDKPG